MKAEKNSKYFNPNVRLPPKAWLERKRYLEAYAYDQRMQPEREKWLFSRNFGKNYRKGD